MPQPVRFTALCFKKAAAALKIPVTRSAPFYGEPACSLPDLYRFIFTRLIRTRGNHPQKAKAAIILIRLHPPIKDACRLSFPTPTRLEDQDLNDGNDAEGLAWNGGKVSRCVCEKRQNHGE